MTQKISEYDLVIKQLYENYQRSPQAYFSECELQYNIYCIFKSLEQFNKTIITKDAVNIGTIHPEYPSVKRVQLEKGKGYRVWFDLAILNPEFIKNSDFKTVWARDERDASLWGNNILAAFEFKFFPKKQINNVKSVQQDCLKLSLCPEIDSKYVIAFSYYEIDELELKNIKVGTSKLYWITPKTVHIL